MALSIGIVGLPNVGKSTLFETITKKQVDKANYPFCTIYPSVGIVPVPDERTRLEILKVHTREMPLEEDVSITELAKEMEGYTGADIEGLCREAALSALRENKKAKKVSMKHFEEAKKSVHASMDEETARVYERMGQEMEKGISKKQRDEISMGYYR